MANVDPTGVVSAVVSQVVSELIGLAKSAFHCKENCSKMEESLAEAAVLVDALKSYVDAEGRPSSSSLPVDLNTWLTKLKAAVEEARPLVSECQSLQNPILDVQKRIKLAKDIDQRSEAIRRHLDAAPRYIGLEILRDCKVRKPKKLPSNVVPKEEQHVVPPDNQIFGMEQTLEQVIPNLLGSPASNRWIGVHGVGGAGKTLLAKRVCDDDRVKGHFDLILWLTFGQSCQVEAKQKELASQIRLGGLSRISNETLRTGLARNRCLLVLDDVWKPGDLELFDVVQENGSKILVTTRIVHVLDSKGALKTKMGLLGKDDSMKLFMVHAFPNGKRDETVNQVVEQVVEKCGGLPLVLKVIGRRMAGRSRQDWDYVLSKLNDQQLASLDEEKQVLQRLKLGYDALGPLRIQQHFLYFAAFPEDWSIGFWQLFRCWKGEGLVADTAEAMHVLEMLKDHALVTEHDRRVYLFTSGQIELDKSYTIHDALLALALHILREEGDPKCYFKAGRLQINDVADAFTRNYKRISLIDNGIQDISLPNNIHTVNTTCLLLDMNPCVVSALLPSLSLFKSLKVLCLRDTGVESLPHSIGQLKNLETLDLSLNWLLRIIPGSLGKLTNLSYLNLESCSNIEVFPVDALLKLTKLVYLNGPARQMWRCDKLHHRWLKHEKCLNRFDGLIRRGLCLDGMSQALTKLEVLIIETKLEIELHTMSASRQCWINLKVLILLGKKLRLSNWDWSIFKSLRTLKVGHCVEGEFGVTSSMENLEELEMRGIHHEELPQEKFPRLKRLNIWQSGVPTISQLASLEHLVIKNCHSLELSLPFLPNLQHFTLYVSGGMTTVNISECPSLTSLCVYGLHGRISFGGKFPQLEQIVLYGLEHHPEGSMDAFPQLRSLAITECRVHQLPEWYASLTSLTYLSLAHSKNLDGIPHGVAMLPLLQTLDLTGCKKIRTLPFADSEDSSFYPSLKFLCLNGTSIPQAQLSSRLRDKLLHAR